MAEITLNNIVAFAVGNFNYYRDKLDMLPEHYKEQALYRLEQCKDDCVATGKCIHCGCPTARKVFAPKTCNNGERFPDFMSDTEWDKFKLENGIDDTFG